MYTVRYSNQNTSGRGARTLESHIVEPTTLLHDIDIFLNENLHNFISIEITKESQLCDIKA